MTKAEQPTITQADRDAAIEYFDPATFAGRDAWLRGDHDDDPLVQAFARHRTTSLAAQDGLVEALELVQKLIGDAFEQIAPLKRQGEDKIWQPASTACVMLWEARDRIAALSAIKGDK